VRGCVMFQQCPLNQLFPWGELFKSATTEFFNSYPRFVQVRLVFSFSSFFLISFVPSMLCILLSICYPFISLMSRSIYLPRPKIIIEDGKKNSC
jgi:hypothetical protein